MTNLNPKLIKQQKLSKKEVKKIQKLHDKKDILFDKVLYWHYEGKRCKVLKSAKKLEKIEFKMQRAWKFDLDYTKHTHWLNHPSCTCPRYQNQDNYGKAIIYYNGCPLHKRFTRKNELFSSVDVSSLTLEQKRKGLYN